MSCDKKPRPQSDREGKAAEDPRRSPPSGERQNLLEDLRYGGTEDVRYKALDRFVETWPRHRESLPEVLSVLGEDEAARGGLALSLARVGPPLVPELVAWVKANPTHRANLLGAGALAYNLVSPQGLKSPPETERAAMAEALGPVREALWPVFLSERVPDYEIYQGLATGGLDTAKRLLVAAQRGALSRMSMVLYLMLTRSPDEVLFSAALRARILEATAALAAPLAKAFAATHPSLGGENPDSLLLGLSVLGPHAAKALATEPGLGRPEACPALAKVLISLSEQADPPALMPARARLAACTEHLADPALGARAKALLTLVETGKQ